MTGTFGLESDDIAKVCCGNTTDDAIDGIFSLKHEETLAVQIILGTVVTLTATVSILGNFLTCLIVYRKTTMRSAINLLLTNMAMADLGLASLVMPFVVCGVLKVSIHTHVIVATIFSILKDTFISVTCYTMLVVSMDRYMIIVHRRDGISSQLAKRCICIVWLVSVAINLPQLQSIRGYPTIFHDHILSGQSMCSFQYVSVVYTITLLCVTFFLPMAAMLYLYAVVLRTVQKCGRKVQNHPGGNVCVSVTQYSCKLGLPTVAVPVRFSGDFTAKRRAFGTILLMFIAVLICWSPYMLNRIVIVGSQSMSYDVRATNVLLCVGFFKSTLYPVTYYFRNKKFRAVCKQIVPSVDILSVRLNTSKQRRINPWSVYECSTSDTRV